MKTTIDFLNGLSVAQSAKFQDNVIKNMPEGVNQIYLDSCGMERCSGYGSYNLYLKVAINSISMNLKIHTNDATKFDSYQDLDYGTRKYENWIKATALLVLDENKDYIIELIQEEDNE